MIVSAVFGKPAWQLARSKVKAQHEAEQAAEERQELREIAGAVARILAGTDDPKKMPEVSSSNPSIRDLLHDVLEETAANTSAVAILRAIMEHHLAEPHGGPIPEYLFRR